ncbi:SSI family serine proteinase inhibitor [Kitasatospora sp. NPDC004531]
MRNSLRVVAAAVVACAGLVAHGGWAGAVGVGRSGVELSVVFASGETRAVTLTCDPDGGTHPTPGAACGLLRSVGGDPGKLDVDPGAICTLESAPVTARLSGTWQGRPAAFSRTYGNPCELHARTGAVFRF